MAALSAAGQGLVRVRLHFDYPPPGSPTCGLCWLLLEPSQVRLVTDLSSLIRDKFGFSRRAKLSLFLDGALLPPTESARLVRDNDCLRVKLEEIIRGDSYDEITNGFTDPSKKERKRQRPKLEAEECKSEDEEHRKRKKSKRKLENFSSQEESSANNQGPKKCKKKRKSVIEKGSVADSKSDDNTSHSRKLKNQVSQEKKQETGNKDKKQKARTLEAKNTSQKTLPAMKNTIAKPSTKKGGTSSESSTSSDSDDSVVHTKQMLSHKTKITVTQHTQKSQGEGSPVKPISAGKLAAKPKDGNSPKLAKSKEAESLSSSSDSDSSSGEEEERQRSNLKCKIPSKKQGTVSGLTSKAKPETSSSESDSSESETCTAKSTKTNTVLGQPLRGNSGKKLPATTCGLSAIPIDAVRGRGRSEALWRGPRIRGCRGMGRGRGRGESPFFFGYDGGYQKQQQLNEAATNTSVIIQNPVEVPKKDYSTLPLLAAPPQVGEKIAFKLLELTENYTPQVSDYKEAKIVSWNSTNKQIELEILSCSAVTKEPGKFDLVYEFPDGTVTIERAVSQDEKITESWDALIEPRLIIDTPNRELTTENGNP